MILLLYTMSYFISSIHVVEKQVNTLHLLVNIHLYVLIGILDNVRTVFDVLILLHEGVQLYNP